MSVMPTIASREVTVVLFEQFELLDVFGPVELLSKVPELRITWAVSYTHLTLPTICSV